MRKAAGGSLPVRRNRGSRGSPLLIPHVRRDVSRFCAIDTERGWETDIAAGEHMLATGVWKKLTKLGFQSGTVYSSIGHIKVMRVKKKDEETRI